MKNLQQASELYWYDVLNLLSYTTLDVKNIHSVVQHKDKLFMVLDYTRNFGNVASEGLMRTTHWAAYYLTNQNYFGILHPNVSDPVRHTSNSTVTTCADGPMAPQSMQKMRDWA